MLTNIHSCKQKINIKIKQTSSNIDLEIHIGCDQASFYMPPFLKYRQRQFRKFANMCFHFVLKCVPNVFRTNVFRFDEYQEQKTVSTLSEHTDSEKCCKSVY